MPWYNKEEEDLKKPTQGKPKFNTSSEAATKVLDTYFEQAPSVPGGLRGEAAAFGSNPFNKAEMVTPVLTNSPTLKQGFQLSGFDAQEIKPKFGPAGLDLDGDGIPDGATVERVVQKQGPNGEQIKDKIQWNKPGRPNFQAGGPAAQNNVQPAGGMNPFEGADPAAQARVNMGLTKVKEGMINPFTGAPTTAQEAIDIRMTQLKDQAAGKFGGSVASRKAAGTELATMKEELARLAQHEEKMDIFGRKLAAPLALEALKAKNEADRLDKDIQARKDVANITGEWGTKKVETGNVGKLAVEELRGKVKKEVSDSIVAGDWKKANLQAQTAMSIAEMNTAAKQFGDELEKEGKIEAAKIIRDRPLDNTAFLLMYSSASEEDKTAIRKSFVEAMTRQRTSGIVPTAGPTTVTPAPQATPSELAPGTIRGNYRFKGGDPSQAVNWEKVG